MRAGRAAVLFLLPTLASLFFFILYPTAFMFYASLLTWGVYAGDITKGKFVGGGNYASILTDPFFLGRVLPLTAQYVGIPLITEFLLGLGLALLASSALRGVKIFRVVLGAPVFIAPVGAAFILGYIMDPSVGLANFMFESIGLPRLGWWGSPKDSMLSVVIVDVWQWTPFIFLILLAGIAGLPREPYEAASIDGAPSWKQFRHITLRLLRPAIIIALLIRLLDLVKSVDTIYVLTRGGPARSTNVFTFQIYWKAFQEYQIGEASALSVILLIIQNVMATLFIWQYQRTMK